MKASSIKSLRNLGVSVTLVILAGLWPSLASASTFVYNLWQISPDVLPENVPALPWTLHGAGSHTVADPSDVLTLTDTGAGSGPYFTHDLTGQISSTSEYETRGHVRILSNSNQGAGALYFEGMYDGSHFMELGMVQTNSTTRFFLADPFGNAVGGTFVDVPGSQFFQVDLKKTGTTGTGADTITLSVDGGAPIITMAYNLLPTTTLKQLEWGVFNGPPVGTAELTGISYGIGELAPLLIPEPSTALLILTGGLLAWRRRHNRVSRK